MIYLDYAGNTPVDPIVLERFCEIERGFIGNPNSKHIVGRNASEKMELVTKSIASQLDVKPSEIIYTSGASEANNLAIKGVARTYRHTGKHILSTCLNHPSANGALTSLQEQGYEIELIDVKPDGTINLEHLKESLRKDTIMVSICLVDSELGVLQPIEYIAEIVKQYPNCYLHVDAAQAVGKIHVDFTGVDLASISSHKFNGLNGSGILIKRENICLEPLIHGGSETTIYRGGTPTLSMAAATDLALQRALHNADKRIIHVDSLNKELLRILRKYPLVRINSTEKSIPFISNISVQGVKAGVFQKALSDRGVCVSVKSACSAEGTPSRPVYAVTGDKKNAMYSFRISLSHLTTEKELESFFEIFDCCYKEI